MAIGTRTRRRRRRGAGAGVVVALTLLGGCGGSDARSGAPGTTAPPTTTAGPMTTTAPEGVASVGCGEAPDVEAIGPDDPGDVAQTLATATGERTYRLAVPEGLDVDEPVPLVVNLHGSGSNALQASIYGSVPRRATDRGMVVATPDARGGRWEIAGEGEDAAFLAALIEDVAARYCVDRTRVHLIGMSLGAWKAAVTACAGLPPVASVALVTVEVFPGSCPRMPVVAFHGTADAVAAYGEGGSQPRPDGPNPGISGTLENMEGWATNGDCEIEADLTDVGDDVVHHRYPGCAPGVAVELYTVVGGGHTWPGADVTLGSRAQTTQTIDATEIALDFFEAHPLPPDRKP